MKTLSRSFAQSVDIGLLNWVVFGALGAISFSYVVLLTLAPPVAERLASEDSLIEDLGAAFCLLAGALFFIAYYVSNCTSNRFFGKETVRNVWLLLLTLLMLLCFGEEISWGQRIFGWSTPPAFKALNAQGETNIHNLWLFHAREPDGDRKTGLALLINFNRLLSIFWLAYCVVVPLLTMFSADARKAIHFLGFPVPSFAVGTLFIINFVIFRYIATYAAMDRATLAAFDELKETNYEFAFLALAFCLMVRLASTSHRASPSAS
jgi:hypothetical protein